MILLPAVFIPDGDDAQRWAEEELRKPVYAEAKPTVFDLWARDAWQFVVDLFSAEGGGQFGPAAIVLVGAIIVAALVVALLVWGVPRRARTVRPRAHDLFGERDDRTAAQLRVDAERCARGEDWAQATILRYRALARGLLERDLIDPAPGATARAIAAEATTIFPAEAAPLAEAATLFDDVRYLEHPGTAERYHMIADLDTRMSTQAPQLVNA